MRGILLIASLVSAAPALASDDAAWTTTRLVCHREVGIAAGATIGGAISWTLAGRNAVGAFSPAFSLACETAKHPVAFSVGIDVAPLYQLYGRDAQEVVREMTALTVGVNFGGVDLRGGPLVSVSYDYAGAGARLLWLPWERGSNPSGFEARVTGFFTTVPNGQLTLMYTSATRL